MAIYRGPGGPGDATADQASTAQLAQTYANEAEASAVAASVSETNAANSATAAASSASAASTSATNAANSATAAETSAGNAEDFATAAETSAGNAETFATAAEVSAGNSEAFSIISFNHAGNAEAFAIAAEVSAGNAEAFSVTASGYADTALSHAGNAESSAIEASGYASAALSHAGNAEAIYDSFDDRYLGAKSSAPSTDNDGDALLTGALYWNTTSNSLFIWSGSAWNPAAFDVSSAVTSFNARTGAVTLSSTDVTTALTYTPLGNADIGVSVQAYDVDTVKYDDVNPSFTDTGAIKVPTGTEAQRPGTPATGQLRFNEDTSGFEGYDGFVWGAIGGGVDYERKTANYTTAAGEGVIADTSGGAWTLTLPSSPASGDYIFIVDGAAWGTNNLTVGRNGSTIEGVAEDLTLDISGAAIQMVYDGTTWQVYAQIGAESGSVVTLDGTQTLTNKTLGATTLSGTLSVADNLVQRPVLKDYAIEGSAIGNVGATRTFDLENANFFSATLDQNSTFTFSNPPASGDFGGFVMELTNGGAFTITWPASVDWPGGTAPTLTASGVDQLVFTTRDGGTTWYGFTAGLDIKTPA